MSCIVITIQQLYSKLIFRDYISNVKFINKKLHLDSKRNKNLLRININN